MTGPHELHARLAFACLFLGLLGSQANLSAPAEPGSNRIEIALSEIRISPAGKEAPHNAELQVLISNHSKKSLCILPTEFRLSYSILYDNGESEFNGGASSTASTQAPKDISDLDLQSVIVPPDAMVKVRIVFRAEIPKGSSGRLGLTYQCRPAYGGSYYRGTLICRDILRTTADIVVIAPPDKGDLVIRPKRRDGNKKEDTFGDTKESPK